MFKKIIDKLKAWCGFSVVAPQLLISIHPDHTHPEEYVVKFTFDWPNENKILIIDKYAKALYLLQMGYFHHILINAFELRTGDKPDSAWMKEKLIGQINDYRTQIQSNESQNTDMRDLCIVPSEVLNINR